MAVLHLQNLIKSLRQRIEDDENSFLGQSVIEMRYMYIDDFIKSEKHSELEKAFFLIIYQFPSASKNYIVHASERVFIPDVYDMSCPGIEYEIDFALYGGSIDNPVKVAIECDGIRSHRQRHTNRDRRKDVNLQAAGWIVMRFGSKEIHDELQKFEEDDNHTSDFLYSIENTITQKVRLIDNTSYVKDEYRSKLTGYKWGNVTCPHCTHNQKDILNHRNILCRRCKTKFKRELMPNEDVWYEEKGFIYFNK